MVKPRLGLRAERGNIVYSYPFTPNWRGMMFYTLGNNGELKPLQNEKPFKYYKPEGYPYERSFNREYTGWNKGGFVTPWNRRNKEAAIRNLGLTHIPKEKLHRGRTYLTYSVTL